MNRLFRNILPHLGAVAVFFVAASAFYYPSWQGKEIRSADMSSYAALSSFLRSYNDTASEPTLWHPRLFSGMPTYLISGYHSGAEKRIIQAVGWGPLRWMPPYVRESFGMMLTFYVMMLLFGASIPAAVIGALAFGFTSNNVIILKAGHMTKAWAILWAPLVVGLTYALFRRGGSMWLWAGLLGLAVAWEVMANHVQITYYLFLMLGMYLVYEAWDAHRNRRWGDFARKAALWVTAVALGVGVNAANLLTVQQYSKDTMRGGSELQRHVKKEGAVRAKGLSREYAFRWSYGIDETLTLLVPNFKGGASAGEVPDDGAVARFLRGKVSKAELQKTLRSMPTYWGEQPFTEGPIYVGALMVFLFLWALFYSRSPLKWWVTATVAVSIVMAWGRHFPALNNLLFEYLPLYNKFRVPSMILWLVSLMVPFWAVLTLDRMVRDGIDRGRFQRALKYALIGVGGLLVMVAVVFPSMYDFRGPNDATYPEWLQDLLPQDRAALMRADAIRSLLFVLAGAAVLWLWEKGKLKAAMLYGAVGVLGVGDVWAVGRRFVSEKEFVRKSVVETPVPLTPADELILQDSDPHYRVLNLTRNPWSDAYTSYYHRHVGGYHAAKLQRYQDLIDYHLIPELQQYVSRGRFDSAVVLNMLDTRYFIARPDRSGVILNPAAAGPAWFVDTVEIVPDPDAELDALYHLPFRRKAVMDRRFENHIPWKGRRQGNAVVYPPDTSRLVRLLDYRPNIVRYRVRTAHPQFVVFSEVYYNDAKGWKAYVDGRPAPHVRVNYILRGMEVPPGDHVVEFRFEPDIVRTGRRIGWMAGVLLWLFVVGGAWTEWRRRAKR